MVTMVSHSQAMQEEVFHSMNIVLIMYLNCVIDVEELHVRVCRC